VPDVTPPVRVQASHDLGIKPAAGHQQEQPVVGPAHVQCNGRPVQDRVAQVRQQQRILEVLGQQVFGAQGEDRHRRVGQRGIDDRGHRAVTPGRDDRANRGPVPRRHRLGQRPQITHDLDHQPLLLKSLPQRLDAPATRPCAGRGIDHDQHATRLGRQIVDHTSHQSDRNMAPPWVGEETNSEP